MPLGGKTARAERDQTMFFFVAADTRMADKTVHYGRGLNALVDLRVRVKIKTNILAWQLWLRD